MNIEHLASGTWRARVYAGTVNGKSVYKSITGLTKKEVELKAAQIQMEATQKKLERSKPAEQRMSVGYVIDAYIQNVNGVLSPTTIRRYQKDRQRFFKGLMDIKLVDLTQAAVQQAVSLDAKRYAPKEYSLRSWSFVCRIECLSAGFSSKDQSTAKSRTGCHCA